MRTRLIWKDCNINNNISSFWVECKDDEVIREILPSLNEYNNQFFDDIKNNRGRNKISEDESDIDFCNFFLISIDYKYIVSFDWVMPYSGMWNAGNPFEKFDVIDFNRLDELEGIYNNLFGNNLNNNKDAQPKSNKKIRTKKNEYI